MSELQNFKIKKVEKKDINKVIYEMNKIFVDTKKNYNFIIWQYFKNIYQSSLYKVTKKNFFVGISGYQKKKLQNKKDIFQLIGLYIISKYRGKNLIKKSINYIIDKKIKKKNFFVIANENLKNSANKIFDNYKIKKLSAIEISKKKISKIKPTFFKKNDLELSKSNNFFFKNKKHFQWRYLNHPIYKYKIFETDKIVIVLKFYKKKNIITLDLTDCYFKKEITLHNLIDTINELTLKNYYNKLNIWTLDKLIINKKLKKMGFIKNKKVKKYFLYRGIKKNYFNNKFIFTGDADY